MLSERSLEHSNELCVCLVDFKKAFDRVKWMKLLDILQMIRIDWRDRKLICKLYMGQKVVVRATRDEYNLCVIRRGVRQGCHRCQYCFLYMSR